MARPDYILLGALVHSDIFTESQASALASKYGKNSYDNPVPFDLNAGMDIALDALGDAMDDDAVEALLKYGDADINGVSDDGPPSWLMRACAIWEFMQHE